MKIAFPFLAWLAGYLIGSLSFAVIVSRAMGLADPRSYGSGNPGATNVLRSGNKAAAILTLVLDALKGFVPVLLVKEFGAPYGLDEGTLALVALRHMSAFAAQLATNLELVYAIVLAALMLGEQHELTPAFYLGAAIILGAVFVHPLLRRPQRISHVEILGTAEARNATE
jgi:acyl-phosphate glycerol 3-phosphate acyltransferase